MDVFGEIGELIFIFDANSFVGVLEEVANSFIASVKVAGVFGTERAHKVVDTIFRGLFDHEMEVIGHEAIGKEGDLSSVVFELAGGRDLQGDSLKVGWRR